MCVCVLSIVPSRVSQPKIQVFSAANRTRSNSCDPFAGLEKKELGQDTDLLHLLTWQESGTAHLNLIP